MSLSSVLGNIPGAAGWLAGAEEQRNRGTQELGQATSLMGLIQHMQQQQAAQKKMQQDELLRRAVSEAGSPEAAIPLLIKQGPEGIRLAGVLAEATKDMRPKVQEPFTLSPGARRFGPDGKLIAEAPPTPEKPEASPEIVRLLKMAEGLPQGHPMRAAIERRIQVMNKDPSTIINMQQPRQVQLTTDEQGNQLVVSPDGTASPLRTPEGAPIRRPPSPATLKAEIAKRKTVTDLNEAIRELEKATAEGGLIDKSTGSGAGALVDMAGNFVGYATPGARAVGQLQPIFDLALKMVPRFEGPQSDKDTQSYKEAAGQIANPNIPNKTKKDAGKTLLRLMKARRGQFMSKEFVGTEADTAPQGSGIKFLGFE